MTNHTHCLHPATKAGRSACRKSGTGFAYTAEDALALKARRARESAPCQECLMVAFSAIDNDVESNDDRAWLRAREYLYDRGAVAACSIHQHLL